MFGNNIDECVDGCVVLLLTSIELLNKMKKTLLLLLATKNYNDKETKSCNISLLVRSFS